MAQVRIHSFSNPYSPKNLSIKKLLSKTQNLNSSFKGSTKNSLSPPARRPTKPKSPLSTHSNPKSIDKVQIAKMDETEKLKKMKGLTLSKDKINKITYSLAVDEQSRNNLQMRMKMNDYYLAYERNPLTQLHNDQNAEQFLHVAQLKKPGYKTLIEAVSALKNKDVYQQLKKKIDKTSKNSEQILMRIKKQRLKENQKVQNIQIEQIHSKVNVATVVKQMLSSPLEQLDELVNIKEENFFMKKRNREPFNLFELKHNPGSPMFKSGREQLNQAFFSFDSMSTSSTNSPSTWNEIFLRGLSSAARISCVNPNSKNIPKDFQIDQRNFKYVDIQTLDLHDLLPVANGQLRPHILKKYINDELVLEKRKIDNEKEEDEAKNQNNDKIIYNDNQRNQLLNFQLQNFQKTELLYLGRGYTTPIQTKQKQISQTYLKQMKDTLLQQLKCLSSYVQDKKIHNMFKKTKDQISLKQLDADVDLNRKMIDTQKKIRLSKVHKNQTEKIKIKEVIQTCRERKVLDLAIKQKNRTNRMRRQGSRSVSRGRSPKSATTSPRNIFK